MGTGIFLTFQIWSYSINFLQIYSMFGGEGVDSARGVVAIVGLCRSSSCNRSWAAIVRSGRRILAFSPLFGAQQLG